MAMLTFLAFLPRTEAWVVVIKLFKEISSSLWDSSVVEDRELESPDDLVDGFLDELSFNFHLDDLLSVGATIDGTAWLASVTLDDSGSDKTESKCDWVSGVVLDSIVVACVKSLAPSEVVSVGSTVDALSA